MSQSLAKGMDALDDRFAWNDEDGHPLEPPRWGWPRAADQAGLLHSPRSTLGWLGVSLRDGTKSELGLAR